MTRMNRMYSWIDSQFSALDEISKSIKELKLKINHKENVLKDMNGARADRDSLMQLLAKKRKIKDGGFTEPTKPTSVTPFKSSAQTPPKKEGTNRNPDKSFEKNSGPSHQSTSDKQAKEVAEEARKNYWEKRRQANRDKQAKEEAEESRLQNERYQGKISDRTKRSEVRDKDIKKVKGRIGLHVGGGLAVGAAAGVGISYLTTRKLKKTLEGLKKDPARNQEKIKSIEKKLRNSKIIGGAVGGTVGALVGAKYNNHKRSVLEKYHPKNEWIRH